MRIICKFKCKNIYFSEDKSYVYNNLRLNLIEAEKDNNKVNRK